MELVAARLYDAGGSMEFLEVGEGNHVLEKLKKMPSLNLFDRLSGNEIKIRVDLTLYYWSVFKECVRGCDSSISLYIL